MTNQTPTSNADGTMISNFEAMKERAESAGLVIAKLGTDGAVSVAHSAAKDMPQMVAEIEFLRRRLTEVEAQLSAANDKMEQEKAALLHCRKRLWDIDGQAHCLKRRLIFERASNVGIFARAPGGDETFCIYWDEAGPVDAEAIRALKSQEIKPSVRDDAWALMLIDRAYDQGRFDECNYLPAKQAEEILTAFLDSERHQGEGK